MQNLESPLREIVSAEYDGRPRRLTIRSCKTCLGTFYAPKHVDKLYCNKDCRGIAERDRVTKVCSWCAVEFQIKRSKEINSKSGLFFCKRSCKDRAQRIGGLQEIQPAHYGKGLYSAYRIHAFRAYGAKCAACGYSEHAKMLDVDHIDNNRKNNDIRNLQVLCVWCHALKTRGVLSHKRMGP